MIYLKEELGEALKAGGKEAVLAALQQAVELEHSTIPTYLYALYSLVPGRNDAVAERIESVVVEEMLHLTLAANVLNALGGGPVLDKADFIPTYPGPLPGSVRDGLMVPLAPCSIDLISRVFMEIEQPEHPLAFPVETATTAHEPRLTIGVFYRRIRDAIVALGDGAFARRPRNQIGPDQLDGSVVVVDTATATQAIDTIIGQGEGTGRAPLEVVGTGYAHYYRFAEIVNGGVLVPNPAAGPKTPPEERYVYDSASQPVAFDAKGVFGAPSNPCAATYPRGTVAQIGNDRFNYTYTGLLTALHKTLNGQPTLLDTALGLMMSLKQQAMDMMSGTGTASQCAGPSFEYQPVKPHP
jgi:rubrerythrin